ncbi:MAG TPA: hypothetical protein H9955_11295 [Candidatus Mediterraneibacter cottocaccae]|nr:hypothetical protein [Candidatus Mediterraneibacter cottocaccae]
MAEKKKRFIGYDYKEVTAEPVRLSLLLDGYESFGWEVIENAGTTAGNGIYNPGVPAKQQGKQTVRLRRERKIINKAELTRLQSNFEACISEIDALERAKTTRPTLTSITVGIIGTAFMAGAVFAVTAQPPLIILSIILAVPGFFGWLVPYFLYREMAAKQADKIRPLIEKKYDEIYELCEKGSGLLH